MSNYAIIAEYNPFHKGHAYQIQHLKEHCNADAVFVIMSGNFVQRGSIAWTDKYLRTKMALSSGADFVFELPFRYATASAEQFALAGVMAANTLPVDYLCFGQETTVTDNKNMQKLALFLANPPKEYHVQCKTHLATGLTYPEARQKTLVSYFPFLKDSPEYLSLPNNILALEYQKALIKTKSSINPFPIKRIGCGYHSKDTSGTFASASAIRSLNLSTETEKLQNALPTKAYEILSSKQNHYPMQDDMLSDLLFSKIMQISHIPKQMQETPDIADLSTELYHRIQKYSNEYHSYTQFISALKTKQYTHTRISRALLHLIFNIKKDTKVFDYYLSENPAFNTLPYLRVLGFSKQKSHLLRNIQNTSLITKPAHAHKLFKENPTTSSWANSLWTEDMTAATVYRYLAQKNLGISLPDEYRSHTIIV